MKPYFVFTLLFLLVVFLWVATIFWLECEAAGGVGCVAAVSTVALIWYGYDRTID